MNQQQSNLKSFKRRNLAVISMHNIYIYSLLDLERENLTNCEFAELAKTGFGFVSELTTCLCTWKVEKCILILE